MSIDFIKNAITPTIKLPPDRYFAPAIAIKKAITAPQSIIISSYIF